ncbi:acyl-CoA dehydrogenase family protein [Paraconexibacter antarcticus]|uniref:Acyl-CoA dehydrogenase family protein n=1 Tax=Paraconexibacter antarcticus TaxID=2949664 RepID=A0ABY5DLH6_9ACTN|nr:acyl-CoA dehydrogenase family protein [Paraconexibacter antarcticus]UTI62321.1 acyl-CoA dehydrogenase family protein [Paraconexibacter antarcticus]
MPSDVPVLPPLVAPEPGALGDLRRRAADVAARIAPDARRWDDEETFPQPSFERIRDAGLLGLTVPRAYGGDGLGVREACVVLEELAVGCMSSAMVAQLYLNGPPRAIATLGDEAQRRRYLPGAADGTRSFAIAISEPGAGSAATELQTCLQADGDGFRLTGEKCYITNGVTADTILVSCRLAGTTGSRGLGAVVVEAGQDGYAPPRSHPKMGGRGMSEAALAFDGVRIDPGAVIVAPDADSSRGAAIMLRQFNPERCGNAAMTLGVARAALDEARLHLRTRRQFGRELAEFQGLQWKVADMATRLEAARLLLASAASSEEDGFPAMRLTAMAKITANETAEPSSSAARRSSCSGTAATPASTRPSGATATCAACRSRAAPWRSCATSSPARSSAGASASSPDGRAHPGGAQPSSDSDSRRPLSSSIASARWTVSML